MLSAKILRPKNCVTELKKNMTNSPQQQLTKLNEHKKFGVPSLLRHSKISLLHKWSSTPRCFATCDFAKYLKLETAFGKEFSEEEISTTSESSVAAQQPTESIPEQDTEDSDFAFGLPAPAT